MRLVVGLRKDTVVFELHSTRHSKGTGVKNGEKEKVWYKVRVTGAGQNFGSPTSKREGLSEKRTE